jgi:hypothetical protein
MLASLKKMAGINSVKLSLFAPKWRSVDKMHQTTAATTTAMLSDFCC